MLYAAKLRYTLGFHLSLKRRADECIDAASHQRLILLRLEGQDNRSQLYDLTPEFSMTHNVQVVEAEGILDGNSATQIRRQITECLQHQANIILLDFKAVTFIDSSGLGALVAALKTVRSAKAQLYICSICDQVKILFELTSMNRVFQVFPDRETFEQEIL